MIDYFRELISEFSFYFKYKIIILGGSKNDSSIKNGADKNEVKN